MSGAPALLVDDLVVRFGELEAVGGVSFAVSPGGVFGLCFAVMLAATTRSYPKAIP